MIARAGQIVLNDASYQQLNALLEARFGLHFPDYRRVILENRLQQRLRSLELDSFDAYCGRLRSDGAELERFVSAVTNNETHFFRARDQFDMLFVRGLDLLRGDLVLEDRVRVLSAACSSGEEVFSILFAAEEAGVALQGLNVTVDGFDIDRERIRFAQSGSCSHRSVQCLSREQVQRYLVQDDGTYQVRREYRARAAFDYGNLIELDTFRQMLPYDAVYCRNALIYFSATSQRRAVENLTAVLRPGGLLFLGHSESVIGMLPNLQTIRLGTCLVYRKLSA